MSEQRRVTLHHFRRFFFATPYGQRTRMDGDGTTCGFLDSLQIAFGKARIALTILLPRLGQCDQKRSKMTWAQLLAYVTGTVDQELLLRNEYLAAENRILKAQIKGRLLLSQEEKATLAEIGHRLGRKALQEVAGAAQPDTILGWYRRLTANKFDGSRFRKRVGRPRVAEEIERFVVRMAKENPSWGYDRIVGALANLGHRLSDQTVGNILRRHGLSPAPKRKQTVSWKDFIRSHRDVLVGMDFFTAEALTLKGLLTYYVLFFIHLETRRVNLAGFTPYPDQEWMEQQARNMTMEEWGCLTGYRYLLH